MMKRSRYPHCPGGAGCSARQGGKAMCRFCQPSTPFGFAPFSCSDIDRLLFGRR